MKKLFLLTAALCAITSSLFADHVKNYTIQDDGDHMTVYFKKDGENKPILIFQNEVKIITLKSDHSLVRYVWDTKQKALKLITKHIINTQDDEEIILEVHKDSGVIRTSNLTIAYKDGGPTIVTNPEKRLFNNSHMLYLNDYHFEENELGHILAFFPDIQYLSLMNTNITDEDLESVKNLKNLKGLNLEHTTITENLLIKLKTKFSIN